jgi:DNA-binding NarL/FixJ family response regulator
MSTPKMNAPETRLGMHPSSRVAGQDEGAIRVMLIDDHPIVRFGLTALLGLHPDIDVVGTAGSGPEAIEFLKIHAVDVLLVDLRMPGCSGIETLKNIARVAPRTRSIVLSSFEYDEEIYDAVRAGAQGYLHKESPAEDILSAIHAVHKGKRAFPRRIAERLSTNKMSAGLSPREREILELVSKGLTNKEVANTLQISQFTVRNHLNHITEKLEVSDRTEAIFVAIQTGLITIS